MKDLLEEGPGFSIYKVTLKGDPFPRMSKIHVKLLADCFKGDGSIQSTECFIYNLEMLRGLRDALNKHLEANQ
jgi:hypothetical protein